MSQYPWTRSDVACSFRAGVAVASGAGKPLHTVVIDGDIETDIYNLMKNLRQLALGEKITPPCLDFKAVRFTSESGAPRIQIDANGLVTERFYEPERVKVDVLFVIDDSASMEPYQQKLAANVAPMLDVLLRAQAESNVDYRLAFTTTSGTGLRSIPIPAGRSHCPNPDDGEAERDSSLGERHYSCAGEGTAPSTGPASEGDPNPPLPMELQLLASGDQGTGHPRIGSLDAVPSSISVLTDELIRTVFCIDLDLEPDAYRAKMTELVQVLASPGTSGKSKERGRESVFQVITDENGFRRPEANLAILLITDEEDSSRGLTPATWVRYLESLKVAENPGAYGLPVSVTFSSVTDDSGYARLTEEVGGTVIPLDSPDWSAALKLTSEQALGMGREYRLQYPAAAGTVQVELLGGTAVPTFSYDPAKQVVVLPPGNEPPPGSVLEIRYLRVPGPKSKEGSSATSAETVVTTARSPEELLAWAECLHSGRNELSKQALGILSALESMPPEVLSEIIQGTTELLPQNREQSLKALQGMMLGSDEALFAILLALLDSVPSIRDTALELLAPTCPGGMDFFEALSAKSKNYPSIGAWVPSIMAQKASDVRATLSSESAELKNLGACGQRLIQLVSSVD